MVVARLFLSLSVLGVAAGKVFVPRSSVLLDQSLDGVHHRDAILDKQLLVRGGAGPIDPDVAGNLLMAACLVQGMAFALAPGPSAEVYGVKCSPLMELCVQGYGIDVVGLGIMAYALLVNGASTNTAIGAGLVAKAAQFFKNILNDVPVKHGIDKNALVFSLLFMVFSAWSMLTNQSYAENVVKALCYYGLVNGVFSWIKPSKFAIFYGMSEKDANDAGYQMFSRACGCGIVAMCAMVLTLLADVEPLKALGYGVAVLGAGLFSQNFITKDVSKLGLDAGAQYFWMTFMAVLCGTILI